MLKLLVLIGDTTVLQASGHFFSTALLPSDFPSTALLCNCVQTSAQPLCRPSYKHGNR